MSAVNISDKSPVSRIYNELLKVQWENNPIKNEQKIETDITKETISIK